uniref:Uncharacterized protein n=1 Tax=Kalanchoe fedtschenkoi TaxID=63787 RepID=A0A7N1A4X0_KALFE
MKMRGGDEMGWKEGERWANEKQIGLGRRAVKEEVAGFLSADESKRRSLYVNPTHNFISLSPLMASCDAARPLVQPLLQRLCVVCMHRMQNVVPLSRFGNHLVYITGNG